ncbi:MAG: ABC-F family ATP-binding cassette domain-containing protein [Bacteroidota bacterium]
MLNLENIGIEFSGRWLLKNATYQFLPGERIGLIGRNGAGKSTLLRMISGDINPTEGNINRAGGLKVAFFNQDLLSYQTERTIDEVARDAFEPVLKLGAEVETLLARMEAGETDETLLNELSSKQELFEAQEGKLIDSKVHSTLSGLGFSQTEQHLPYQTFSGGWRMRVLLAKMLLMQPDILLLDEPTNHLDLPSIQWLENYLRTFRGTTIVVSHDRFFIDRMAQKIVEISFQQLQVYNGNYAYYLKEKALRHEQHIKEYENQQKYFAEQERFINRFRYKASKARQVQSKIKQLEKIERLQPPEEETIGLNIRFTMKLRSGKEVLRLKEIHKAYDKKLILENTSATVMRGDKIGLIGANGLGKSTLLRILAGTEPHEGVKEAGYQVQDSFFAQHQLEALNLKNSILEELEATVRDRTETEIRNLLGSFMFTGEDVDKKIQVLSGGEKSRVALAKTLVSEANFLLLDEPTNHLDIQSIQILVEALNAYEGTYVLVSHDRYFLEQVSNKIWYIEDHQVKEYPGNYAEYSEWKARQEAALQASEAPELSVPRVAVEEEKSTQTAGLSYQEQKQRKNRIKKLQRDQEGAEAKIEELEAVVAQLELKMADPEIATDFDKLQAAQKEYQATQQQLESQIEAWEAILTELESYD